MDDDIAAIDELPAARVGGLVPVDHAHSKVVDLIPDLMHDAPEVSYRRYGRDDEALRPGALRRDVDGCDVRALVVFEKSLELICIYLRILFHINPL